MEDDSDIEVICLDSPIKATTSTNFARTRKPVKACTLISSSDEEDLPDIDDFDGIKKSHLSNTLKNGLNLNTGYIKEKNLNNNNSRPSSQESNCQSTVSTKYSVCSSNSTTSSVSNSQASQASISKKQQKEAEAERKRLEKEAKKVEKEIKKAEIAREKELKKMENELHKSTKPGESIKFMTVVLDELIITKLDTIIPELVAADIKYQMVSSPLIENSISFQRETFHQAMNDELQIQKISRVHEEDQLMILLDSDKAIPMMNAQLKKHGIVDDDYVINLVDWVVSIKASNTKKKITILLFDLDKYFRKLKRSTQQDFRNRVLTANDDQPQRKRRKNKKDLPQISQTELQSALIELQLQTGVNYRMVKDSKELATYLFQYTKAIAEAPFKQQRLESQGFDWFALSDSAGSVKIDKEGNGLKALWIDQLQQFNSVGLDIATAIANEYPCPKALLEAYTQCDDVDEGQNLLRNLSVITGIGPLAKTRKVGPELSKKMYRFFTSTNGDRFLGSTLDMR